MQKGLSCLAVNVELVLIRVASREPTDEACSDPVVAEKSAVVFGEEQTMSPVVSKEARFVNFKVAHASCL